MSENWTATVLRVNTNTDVLIAKVPGRISRDHATRIKEQLEQVMPLVKVLVVDQGCEFAVVSKRRAKTLVRAGRRK